MVDGSFGTANADNSGEDGYRGPEACKKAGVTYRQLDYWARTGLVPPSIERGEGQGRYRLFSEDDLLRLRLIRRLIDEGASLQGVRYALEYAGERWKDAIYAVNGNAVFPFQGDEIVNMVASGCVGPFVSPEQLRSVTA